VDDATAAIVLARMPAGPLRDAYLDSDRRGWTPLMQAVVDGDDRSVAAAIAEGADVDAIAEGAETALALACTAGSEAIVASLLDAGADAEARAPHDRSALHLAARHGSVSLVRLLLDAGARLTFDDDGESPLAVAIEHESSAVLELLLEQPLPRFEPERAFGFACERGRAAAVQRLWDRFGTVLPTGSPSPLMRAARGGNSDVVHFLVDAGADVNAFDLKEELSPLMHAAKAGRLEAAKALLERGANPNATTEWFVSALRNAEQRGDQPMIDLLRAYGATSSDAPTILVVMPWDALPRPISSSWSSAAIANDDVLALSQQVGPNPVRALCDAASAGATHSVAYLLACGVDPHAGAPSALERAIRASHARGVRLMLAARPAPLDAMITRAAASQSDPWILAEVLDRGAPVDTPVYGSRPIEEAAREGRWKHVALLADRGAPIRDDTARTSPLLIAARLGHVRCVETLVDRGGASGTTSGGRRRIDVALLEAVEHPRVIDALVRRGADPDAIDRDGDSLLHLGAQSQRVPIDVYLSLAGRFLATPGRLGWAPLHNAALAGTTQTIEALIRAGADVDARDTDGRTPLHIACTYPRPQIVETLVAAGASLDVRDKDGASPLHRAACVGPEPVEVLIAAGADRNARDDRGRTALDRAEVEITTGDYRTHARRLQALALLRGL
jgi:ankyrin repeat protein